MDKRFTLSQIFKSSFDEIVKTPKKYNNDNDGAPLPPPSKKAKHDIHLRRNGSRVEIVYDGRPKPNGLTEADFVLPCLKLDINELCKDLLNSSIAVFGGSKSGKTVFTSFLLYSFFYAFRHKKIGLVIIARTLNGYEKLKNISEILKKKTGYSIDFTNVLCVNDAKHLEQLYFAIYEKAAKDKGLAEIDPSLKDNGGVLPDKVRTLLSQFTNFVFYFDDCSDMYSNPAYKSFFNTMPTMHRHAMITVVYNTHTFQHMNQNIRQNINNIAIAGICAERVVKLIFESIHLVGAVFQRSSRLTKLIFNKERFFNNSRTIILIREPPSREQKDVPSRAIYHYCMNSEFVNELILMESNIKTIESNKEQAACSG